MKERIIFFDASRIIVIVPVAVNITFKKYVLDILLKHNNIHTYTLHKANDVKFL